MLTKRINQVGGNVRTFIIDFYTFFYFATNEKPPAGR